MSILEIIKAPDARLKLVSDPVDRVAEETRKLMDDMLDTMYAALGIGLSAIQVGVAKRVVVIDTAKDPSPPQPIRMANPVISWQSDIAELREEGCLSFPDQSAEVRRPLEVEVQYLDECNVLKDYKASGLTAIAIQHELDHLDGVLLIDRISATRRSMILRKMKKARRVKTFGTN